MAPYLHYTIFISVKKNKIGQTDFPCYNENRKGAKRQRLAPLEVQQINRRTWLEGGGFSVDENERNEFICVWR